MDINSPNWIVLNNSPTQLHDSYQFIQAVEIKGEAGILAISTQALPCIQHSSAYYLQNQRSQKGAEIAIEASRQAFETLQEQQLDFDSDFLNLLTKYWKNTISLHFVAHPLGNKKAKNQQKNTTLSNNSPNALLNLTSLYDTAISVVLLTDTQLQVYQIADSQLVLLNKQHNIGINSTKEKLPLSFPQYLAHPELSEIYPCQCIDIERYQLEMLVLYAQKNKTITTQELHGEIYQLARQLDTQGVNYAKSLQDPDANQIVIKRNRQWHDGISHALNRESYHLHRKVDFQSQQIDQLETEIYQLSLSQRGRGRRSSNSIERPQENPNAYVIPKQKKKNLSIGAVAATLSTIALVTTSTIAYSVWQVSQTNELKVAKNHTGEVLSEQQYLRNIAFKNTETLPTISKQFKTRINNRVDTVFTANATVDNKAETSTFDTIFATHRSPHPIDKLTENSEKNQFSNIKKHQNNVTINQPPIKKVIKNIDPVDLIVTDLKKNEQKAPLSFSPPKKAFIIATAKNKHQTPVSKSKKRKQQHKARKKTVHKPRKMVMKKPIHKSIPAKQQQPARTTKNTHIAQSQPAQKRHQKPVSNAIQHRKARPATVKKASYVAKAKIRAVRKNHKTSHNKLTLAKTRLENAQKQTIIQQIITNSTTFASHTLRLKKKRKEISIINRLYVATKNQAYANQKQLLERRQTQLNQKMQRLSQQYSQQLKRLCQYSPPYSTTLSTQATPLERIALSHLKQQLRNCSHPKNNSAKFISKMLRNNYQKLASR